MKRNWFAALIAALTFGLAPPALAQECPAVPETVAEVDLERYMGTWYEIASIPQSFQEGCYNTTANYKMTWSGKVRVKNSCNIDGPEGRLNVARGIARAVDDSGSKLEVTFFWPFWGDYWVLELDSDYQWAVVGNPDRDALWILSRTPVLDEEVITELMFRIEDKHCYDVNLIERSFQSERI